MQNMKRHRAGAVSLPQGASHHLLHQRLSVEHECDHRDPICRCFAHVMPACGQHARLDVHRFTYLRMCLCSWGQAPTGVRHTVVSSAGELFVLCFDVRCITTVKSIRLLFHGAFAPQSRALRPRTHPRRNHHETTTKPLDFYRQIDETGGYYRIKIY